ncbi:hypothetical protein M0R45_015432 [Rubus argutus]|uniref:Uncharacterized protein n=1 Tax=Rubus argutus TaxID=59490 RepID=A0AAW1XRM7_RUBAR
MKHGKGGGGMKRMKAQAGLSKGKLHKALLRGGGDDSGADFPSAAPSPAHNASNADAGNTSAQAVTTHRVTKPSISSARHCRRAQSASSVHHHCRRH